MGVAVVKGADVGHVVCASYAKNRNRASNDQLFLINEQYLATGGEELPAFPEKAAENKPDGKP